MEEEPYDTTLYPIKDIVKAFLTPTPAPDAEMCMKVNCGVCPEAEVSSYCPYKLDAEYVSVRREDLEWGVGVLQATEDALMASKYASSSWKRLKAALGDKI